MADFQGTCLSKSRLKHLFNQYFETNVMYILFFFSYRDLSYFKYKLWQFRWYFASRACNPEKFPSTSLKGSASFFCLHCVLLLSTVSSLKNLINRVSPHVLLIYKKDIKRYSLWLSSWFSTVSSLFQITKSFKCGETMGLQ